jgi:hypothetical protein
MLFYDSEFFITLVTASNDLWRHTVILCKVDTYLKQTNKIYLNDCNVSSIELRI